MIIRPKHYLLLILGFILSSGIFYVNYFLFHGNTFGSCLYLSVFTFLLWWFCWSLYFEIRDFWQFRWYGQEVDRTSIEITPLTIPLNFTPDNDETIIAKRNQKHLGGEWIRRHDISNDAPIVIFVHGFSDDSVYIRHYTIPLAQAGFNVIAYDNRGTKKSKKAGRKSQFVQIVNDLNEVIMFIRHDSRFSHLDVHLIGISLGAIAVIRQGLQFATQQWCGKIIAISTMSNYKKSIPFSPVPFLKNWWLLLRYTFFGVPINPIPEINFVLSPVLQIRSKKGEKNTQLNTVIKEKFNLIHAENDAIIPVSHFWENLNELNLEFSHWLLTKKGGHNFLRYEPLVLTQILRILWDNSKI
ncbi:MAG: alpha/beta hydrolase [Promethearchaeota archaeon]